MGDLEGAEARGGAGKSRSRPAGRSRGGGFRRSRTKACNAVSRCGPRRSRSCPGTPDLHSETWGGRRGAPSPSPADAAVTPGRGGARRARTRAAWRDVRGDEGGHTACSGRRFAFGPGCWFKGCPQGVKARGWRSWAGATTRRSWSSRCQRPLHRVATRGRVPAQRGGDIRPRKRAPLSVLCQQATGLGRCQESPSTCRPARPRGQVSGGPPWTGPRSPTVPRTPGAAGLGPGAPSRSPAPALAPRQSVSIRSLAGHLAGGTHS